MTANLASAIRERLINKTIMVRGEAYSKTVNFIFTLKNLDINVREVK